MSNSRSPRPAPSQPAAGYLVQSELPLASLLFLLPLIVVYEVGTHVYSTDPSGQTEQRIIAFTLMRGFFAWFGASGSYLPPLAVIGILLTWHFARNDPWRIHPLTFGGMALESTALGLPLVALSVVSTLYLPLLASPGNWQGMIILSIGAGIYEELVFRLICFAFFSFLLIDLFGMKQTGGCIVIVLLSALLFAAYHYLGAEPFQWQSFAFRTGAGVYFGVLFLTRGFGITAGAHAAYDVCIVLFSDFSSPS